MSVETFDTVEASTVEIDKLLWIEVGEAYFARACIFGTWRLVLSLRPSDVLMIVALADVGVSDAVHDTGNGSFRRALVHSQLDDGERVRLFAALNYVWRRRWRELYFAAADPRKIPTWKVDPRWITFWQRIHDF